jgi:hypothetical protein
MASGTADGTIAVEDELSRLLGLAAAAALRRRNGWNDLVRGDLGDPR